MCALDALLWRHLLIDCSTGVWSTAVESSHVKEFVSSLAELLCLRSRGYIGKPMTTASASDRVGRAFWPYHFSGANGLSRQPHLFKSVRVGASYVKRIF